MKILAIDSSGLVASVAVVEEDRVLAEYTVNNQKTHSQTLLPMIAELQNMLKLDLETLDAIAIAGGPGSFTGLRIGSATAKGLGLALEKPIVSVPTVDALAYQLYGTADLICPLMDARRSQVYTGIYSWEKGLFSVELSARAVSLEQILTMLNERNRPVIFLGDGVPVYQNQIKEQLHVPFLFAPPFANRQRAAALGILACAYWKEGRFESADDHRPEYFRMSQAERERLEQESAKKAEQAVQEDQEKAAESEKLPV